jgi:hypothetical protein
MLSIRRWFFDHKHPQRRAKNALFAVVFYIFPDLPEVFDATFSWQAWLETLYVVAWMREYAQHIGRSNFFVCLVKTS